MDSKKNKNGVIEKLKNFLEDEASEISERIKSYIKDIDYSGKFGEVQMESLNERQLLVENIQNISIKIVIQTSIKDNKIAQISSKHGDEINRYDWKQRESYINYLLKDEILILEMLKNQRIFYENSIKTLDNIQFALKRKIDSGNY